MKKLLALVAAFFVLASIAVIAQQAITNVDVVKMTNAGLSPDVIVAAIRNAPAKNFDTSPDALIKLKADGVSDAVIAAMLTSSSPAATFSSAPAGDKSDKNGTEPFLVLEYNGEKKEIPSSRAQVAQVKGEHLSGDLKSMALDGAVASAIMEVGAQAAFRAGTSILAAPVIGSLAGTVVGMGSLLNSGPKYTMILVLPKSSSENVLYANSFSAELLYGNIPGIDPDAYEPQVLRLAPTASNTRLVKAQVVRMQRGGSFKMTDKSLVETVPAEVEIKNRGHALLRVSDLAPGEYAIMLRLKGKNKSEISVFSAGSKIQEAANDLSVTVWDFAVRQKSS